MGSMSRIPKLASSNRRGRDRARGSPLRCSVSSLSARSMRCSDVQPADLRERRARSAPRAMLRASCLTARICVSRRAAPRPGSWPSSRPTRQSTARRGTSSIESHFKPTRRRFVRSRANSSRILPRFSRPIRPFVSRLAVTPTTPGTPRRISGCRRHAPRPS